MTEYNNNIPYEEESEIDIMELISKLWKRKSMIIKWCIAGAIVGLVVGFSIPKTYTASTVLAPESNDAKGGGLLSFCLLQQNVVCHRFQFHTNSSNTVFRPRRWAACIYIVISTRLS